MDTYSILPLDQIGYYAFLMLTFYGAKHLGQDFKGYLNKPILAPSDGKILGIREGNQTGICVYMLAPDNTLHRIAHCSVKTWELQTVREVKKGEVIAYMGNTGLSTNVHTHHDIQPTDGTVTTLSAAIAWTSRSLSIIENAKKESEESWTNAVIARFIDPIVWAINGPYNPEKVSEWAIEAVNWCKEQGIMDATEHPQEVMTAERQAVTLHRLFLLLSTKENVLK